MTEAEIIRSYEEAKNKKKQISILAELNCCSKDKILKIVQPVAEKKEDSEEWTPTKEQKAYMDRLDELNSKIKPLEDEYKRTAKALIESFKETEVIH